MGVESVDADADVVENPQYGEVQRKVVSRAKTEKRKGDFGHRDMMHIMSRCGNDMKVFGMRQEDLHNDEDCTHSMICILIQVMFSQTLLRTCDRRFGEVLSAFILWR